MKLTSLNPIFLQKFIFFETERLSKLLIHPQYYHIQVNFNYQGQDRTREKDKHQERSQEKEGH